MLEYDRGKASALIEYKNEHAAPQYASHPTYQAMIDLGNRAQIPVIAVRYADDYSWWRVTPLNNYAKQYISRRTEMTEIEYVTLLYKIRGYDLPQQFKNGFSIEI